MRCPTVCRSSSDVAWRSRVRSRPESNTLAAPSDLPIWHRRIPAAGVRLDSDGPRIPEGRRTRSVARFTGRRYDGERVPSGRCPLFSDGGLGDDGGPADARRRSRDTGRAPDAGAHTRVGTWNGPSAAGGSSGRHPVTSSSATGSSSPSGTEISPPCRSSRGSGSPGRRPPPARPRRSAQGTGRQVVAPAAVGALARKVGGCG